ncbi:S26 family signal peptidase [Microtetraspora malaysiensis]|uniref:S26 family signal peptidase n=1 Tax=Microtetraspora malaysiensis TaxID=161358 RepID=UPI0009FE2772|nr:S26 family signal peptidase [Microtetraspora malaysiensis]
MRGAFFFAAIALGLVWVRRRMLVAQVVGTSMMPTYFDGDRLLAVRCGAVRVRQVVVVRNPHVPRSSLLVKRVAAVAGGLVPPGVAGNVVPPGHLAVLGDNPDQSMDSRQLGFIPVHHVVARVLLRISH